MKLSSLYLVFLCLSSTLAAGAAPSTKPAETPAVVAKTTAPYTHHMKIGSKICEIQVPAHFELKHEGGDAVGKAYFFVGQKKAIGSPALSVAIIITPAGQPVPVIAAVMNSMLDPARKNIVACKETTGKVEINGHSYQFVRLEGKRNDDPVQETSYFTAIKDTFFIVSLRDCAPLAGTTMADLMKSLNSFKIGA